ncbi:hypothetical protein SAMN02910358_00840 [Lachnospiraceae bacterium XBB1006]|nr:hypothetical protein SAMN02910358_00840 [Lachnospiraceae bacterium XBB1006]
MRRIRQVILSACLLLLCSAMCKMPGATAEAKKLTIHIKNAETDPKVMWEKVKGATGYEIYRKMPSERAFKKVATVKGSRYVDYQWEPNYVMDAKGIWYKVRFYKLRNGKRSYSSFSAKKHWNLRRINTEKSLKSYLKKAVKNKKKKRLCFLTGMNLTTEMASKAYKDAFLSMGYLGTIKSMKSAYYGIYKVVNISIDRTDLVKVKIAKSSKDFYKKAFRLMKSNDYRTRIYSTKVNYRKLFEAVCYHHPEYLNGKEPVISRDEKSYWFEPYANYTKKRIKTENAQVEKEAKQIVAAIIKPGMSTRQKLLAIHNYLVVTTEYDSEAQATRVRSSNPAHNAYGCLILHKCVCDGYAGAFNLLASYAKIPSISVAANGHAWNYVKIDGRYRYVDVTWDDPVPDQGKVVTSTRYFDVSKAVMEIAHGTWNTTYYSKTYLGYMSELIN